MSGGSARGGRRLEPAVRETLEEFFGADLSDVSLHRGPLSAWICRTLGAGAVTLGRRICFSPAGWARYRRGGEEGLALVAHETVHVLQYRRRGFWSMLLRYLAHYFAGRLRGRPHRSAYRANPYEREAFAVERRFREHLRR